MREVVSSIPDRGNVVGLVFHPTRAQDYKEKHKLDSKQISDSVFGTHLSFCKKIGDYKAFQDQTQNSQFELRIDRKLARFIPGGEKRNQNRDSIKCGKRMAGKGDSAIQCYMQ